MIRKKDNGVVKDVYPLKLQKIKMGEDVVYDRNTRGKSWFILDLAVSNARRTTERGN